MRVVVAARVPKDIAAAHPGAGDVVVADRRGGAVLQRGRLAAAGAGHRRPGSTGARATACASDSCSGAPAAAGRAWPGAAAAARGARRATATHSTPAGDRASRAGDSPSRAGPRGARAGGPAVPARPRRAAAGAAARAGCPRRRRPFRPDRFPLVRSRRRPSFRRGPSWSCRPCCRRFPTRPPYPTCHPIRRIRTSRTRAKTRRLRQSTRGALPARRSCPRVPERCACRRRGTSPSLARPRRTCDGRNF